MKWLSVLFVFLLAGCVEPNYSIDDDAGNTGTVEGRGDPHLVTIIVTDWRGTPIPDAGIHVEGDIFSGIRLGLQTDENGEAFLTVNGTHDLKILAGTENTTTEGYARIFDRDETLQIKLYPAELTYANEGAFELSRKAPGGVVIGSEDHVLPWQFDESNQGAMVERLVSISYRLEFELDEVEQLIGMVNENRLLVTPSGGDLTVKRTYGATWESGNVTFTHPADVSFRVRYIDHVLTLDEIPYTFTATASFDGPAYGKIVN